MSGRTQIELEGVRVHNLKNVSLKIRHRALTVICGVSGSGKSSLAFDTLYAEGQRRYIETFSPTARQFLDRIERPAADRISGIPPAIAIRQNQGTYGSGTTIGTRTEILDYLRLLFVRAGRQECPDCRIPVASYSGETAASWLLQHHPGGRAIIAFELTADDGDATASAAPLEISAVDIIPVLQQRGFARVIAGDVILRLDQLSSDARLPAPLLVVLDRLRLQSDLAGRLAESLESALTAGDGSCVVFTDTPESVNDSAAPPMSAATPDPPSVTLDGVAWRRHVYSNHRRCPGCQREFPEPTPELLNFNSPVGACPDCQGTGSMAATTANRVVTKEPQTIRDGAICPACRGTRLNRHAGAMGLNNAAFTELLDQDIEQVSRWLADVSEHLPAATQRALHSVTEHLKHRLQFLNDCGLGYLTLSRTMRTLSGGEAQRVLLTSALGTGLISTLYVLDEPTSGLHERDTQRVIAAAQRLKAVGNTVVVVEHDPQFILAADEIVEIGPEAGERGGQVVFQGTPRELLHSADSVTAARLREVVDSEWPAAAAHHPSRRVPETWLTVQGVDCHNIQDLTVRIPLGVIAAITGVSGSGKSSLIVNALYPAMCQALGQPCRVEQPGRVSGIDGLQALDSVLLLDQKPLQKGSRSVPATWIGVFDDIRKLMSETHEAKKRNYSPATFSFNSDRGGRCPVCHGLGQATVEMQFLADIETTCEECHGRRFRPEILEVRYRNRSVSDILDMTTDDAFPFFLGQPRIQQRLNAVRQAGLGYLRLGQPLSTLSGGEAQRLRIAALLAGLPLTDGELEAANRQPARVRQSARTLFILDEPSTGLHPQDINRLMNCLNHLVQTGHSVILIDHDVCLLRQTDYRIELGPGPGTHGGHVIAEG